MNRILIVEDDKDISRELKELLENSGYEAVVLTDFKNACDSIIAAEPDLVLLDINIPYMNGEMLLQQLRSKSDVPVIMVTAKEAEFDKVKGLEGGADDYITKPYSPSELAARVKSSIRRYTSLGSESAESKTDVITVGGLEYDINEKTLSVDGEPVRLTAKELKIIELFMKNPGRVFSAEQIYTNVWNEEAFAVENTVMVHIRHLREKIEINPKNPKYIKVVWGGRIQA